MAIPAPPVPQKSSTNTWLIGCAIGCGGLLVLGIIISVVGFFVVKKGIDMGLEQAANELPGEATTAYEKAKEEGYVPEEHQALFEDLLALSKRTDATPYVRVVSAVMVIIPLDDKEVTESEIKVLTTASTFLKENPQAGFFDMISFMQSHPELEDTVREIPRVIEQPQAE